MKRQWILGVGVVVWGIWAGGSLLQAQQAPDLIFYNGKIVTVDNHEVNAELGTIAQAIAIRDGEIVAIGSNAPVRAMAGPNTESSDLKGRTVLPGLAATHDHPTDWDPLNPLIVKKVVTDDMHIERFLEDSPFEQLRQFPQVLSDAVEKAKPGQWIRISMLFGKEYRGGTQIRGFFGRQITKDILDRAAPNNPVMVRAGFTGMLVNKKAIDEIKRHYGDEWAKFENDGRSFEATDAPVNARMEETGYCGVCYREFEQDALYPPSVLREIYRLGLSWWAGYGVTMNSSNMYTAGAIDAYNTLDRNGQMAIRLPWTYFWPERKSFFLDPYFRRFVVAMKDRGSDYFWLNGAIPSYYGGSCSSLPGTSPEVKEREDGCRFDPVTGTENRTILYEYIKAGGRFAGAHTGGDKEIDYILDIIEQASNDAGMTLEQIRAKRHTYDHMAMSPRPDQIPRIKNLGMQTGGWDLSIREGAVRLVLANYGEEATQWVIPRKSLFAAGVRNSVEIDRPLGYTNLTYFTVFHVGITRKDQDGRITAPAQAVSREAMLKAATLFGAYYAMREDKFGSLEPGKFADLIVLDRDYLTIPVDDIQNIRVLMTMVGGKVVHLVPSLASEWRMQPTGAQVQLGGPAAQW